ncbi:hypothetical protein ACS0TY_004629 [Phlomoides rotata]
MDANLGYTTTLATPSTDRSKVVDNAGVCGLNLYSPGVFGPFVPKGSKRKSCAVNRPIHLKDGSLDLGLGLSSSSCTSICSGKETEDETILDLGLSINLNGGDNRLSNQKQSSGTSNAVNVKKPVLDLQLSLSTEPAESDVTTVAQGFTSYQNHSESLALTPPVQLVDEGSTSSRWKNGPLVPPLDILIPYSQDPGNVNPNPVAPTISSENKRPRRSSVKTCRFEGCTRGARGASGLCIAHGGGRRCQKAGCHKGAEGKTVFCKAHGGGRRCQHLGCTKSAEGRTDYCIGHGGGRRCSHEGCSRAARGKSGLCIRHGGGKRCTIENCTKSAEGITGLCISHGGGRRCQYPECTKGAQGSTMYCKAHGGGRRCTFLGCTKGAEGSTLFCKAHGGGKRCTSEGCTKSVHGGTLFCVSHGGGKRCAMPDCTKSARGRTNYCVRHGGGKRCKFEGCPKSAQGSTDYCKAHGGGKRCLWGQLGSGFGEEGTVVCDKFARGKLGLCAAHSAQVQEKEISGPEFSTSTMMNSSFISGSNTSYHGATSVDSMSYGNPATSLPFMGRKACLDDMSLPEGRVHGGSLMAMLGGGTIFIANSTSQEGSGPSEP